MTKNETKAQLFKRILSKLSSEEIELMRVTLDLYFPETKFENLSNEELDYIMEIWKETKYKS